MTPAHQYARRFHAMHSELRAAVDGSRYFREDKLASDVARKLRGFSDGDLAWIAWLSPPNMALVCERFETTEDILRLAQVYETARRRAYPERQMNIPIAPHDAADARGTKGRLTGSARSPLRLARAGNPGLMDRCR